MSGKEMFDRFLRIPNEHFNSYFLRLTTTVAENRETHPLRNALPEICSKKAEDESAPEEAGAK